MQLSTRAMAVMAGAGAVALGYVLAQALAWPMVWFDPVKYAFSTGARPSSAAMDFFGRSLWALASGAGAAVVAAGAFRRGAGVRAARVMALVAAAAVLVSFGLEVRRLSGRVPVSEELPAGYDPITGRVVVQPQRVVQR